MLLWNITEIEKKGQDAVDIEVLEEAKSVHEGQLSHAISST
jgi:hypothetical protein